MISNQWALKLKAARRVFNGWGGGEKVKFPFQLIKNYNKNKYNVFTFFCKQTFVYATPEFCAYQYSHKYFCNTPNQGRLPLNFALTNIHIITCVIHQNRRRSGEPITGEGGCKRKSWTSVSSYFVHTRSSQTQILDICFLIFRTYKKFTNANPEHLFPHISCIQEVRKRKPWTHLFPHISYIQGVQKIITSSNITVSSDYPDSSDRIPKVAQQA